jgi:hypothetical protein
VVSGIFYDPKARQLHAVEQGTPRPDWAFVTHNLQAGEYQCRRIMREWLPSDVLSTIEWSCFQRRSA